MVRLRWRASLEACNCRSSAGAWGCGRSWRA